MTLHIGLIGGGNISETHARAAQAIPEIKIAAIQGTNAEKVARLCQEYGATPYRDIEPFLKHRSLEIVLLGSPSGLHAAQGIAAAEMGLHILTEKPIEISTARADAMIAAAQKSQVKLGVIFQDRTKPHIRLLKSWLDERLLGKILLVEASVKWYRPPEYYANSRWRGTLQLDGGGALVNQGIHTLDLLLWLVGDVIRVQARTATLLHRIEGEDTAAATLEFSNGALGQFYATTAAYPGYPRRLEITGTEGTVVLEHDRLLKVELRTPSKKIAADLAEASDSAGDRNRNASSASVSDVRGHQAVLEDFLAAIKENRRPLCDGMEGRRSIALVEAIYRAAKTPDEMIPARSMTP